MASFTGQGLAATFLTSIVVEKCQSSCQSVARNLDDEAAEHEIINDLISACSEYSTAAARDSRHRRRYAAWCAERCSEAASVCDKLGDATARRCARWCRLLLTELDREINWKEVKKVMNSDINWGGVKNTLNKEVKLPWGG
jgi:hypothetical protein